MVAMRMRACVLCMSRLPKLTQMKQRAKDAQEASKSWLRRGDPSMSQHRRRADPGQRVKPLRFGHSADGREGGREECWEDLAHYFS